MTITHEERLKAEAVRVQSNVNQDKQTTKDNQGQTRIAISAKKTSLLSPVSIFVAFIKEAIEQNPVIEDYPGKVWETPLWGFIRTLKSDSNFKQRDADSALELIEATLKHIQGGKMDDLWREPFDLDEEEARLEFLDTWPKVRFEVGFDPLKSAFEKSQQSPLTPQKHAMLKNYWRFLSIAYWLQKGSKKPTIVLPLERLAPLLECSLKNVSRYRSIAKSDGYIQETRPYSYTGKKATEFKVHTELLAQ